jgi:NAD(P)-dependent dehydrogenase (short-subunit alcohol dehydrogenase family)
MPTTTVAGKAVLMTGANRGLGQALVDEALQRGVRRVFAASRRPLAHADERVTPLMLDVTDPAQIQRAVEQVDSLDILINNAGVSVPDDLSDRSAFERHLAVNLYGTLDVTQAFLPALTRSQRAVVNVVSVGALAAVPVLPADSVSKAAALSLTQSLRALLAWHGVSVQAVLPGPIDTDMVRDLPIRRPRRRRSLAASSTASRTARKRSSPTQWRRCSPTAGAPASRRNSKARTRRSFSRSPWRHERGSARAPRGARGVVLAPAHRPTTDQAKEDRP